MTFHEKKHNILLTISFFVAIIRSIRYSCGCIFSVCIIRLCDRYTSCFRCDQHLNSNFVYIIIKFILTVKKILDIIYTNSKINLLKEIRYVLSPFAFLQKTQIKSLFILLSSSSTNIIPFFFYFLISHNIMKNQAFL